MLWRPEKTSYRSYSCTVSLCDPAGYEGGEVQFFAKWGDKDPIVSYKCAEGCGVAFCGCQRNIHAVTGITGGWRLVLLVWTRPPDVRVPDNQTHVCYFRPGTGLGVWLTTADILRASSRKCYRSNGIQSWVPKDEDDGTCQCNNCTVERKKKLHGEIAAAQATSSRGRMNRSSRRHWPWRRRLRPPQRARATHHALKRQGMRVPRTSHRAAHQAKTGTSQ